MNLLILTFVFWLSMSVAEAQLGETRDQCANEALLIREQMITVEKVKLNVLFLGENQYLIAAWMLNGRVSYLNISKVDSSPITASELSEVLHANAEGMAWKKNDTTSSSQSWIRTDGAVAKYDAAAKMATLNSPAMVAVLEFTDLNRPKVSQ